MDLDELKAKWTEQDRKLETILHLNRQLVHAATMNPVRSAMQRLAWFLALEAAIQLVAVIALGTFLYDNIAIGRYAIPAVVLDVFAIAILNVLIRHMVLALQIDYGKPLAVIQKQLEGLRMLRIRYTQWIFLTATLIWTPLLIVAFKGFFDLDAYQVFGGVFLAANLLLGLAVISLGIWLSRKFGHRMSRSPLMQRLMKDLAGYNLNAATDFLAKVAEFEDDKHAG